MADTVTDEDRAAAQEALGLTDERAAQIVSVRHTATGRNWIVTFDDGAHIQART